MKTASNYLICIFLCAFWVLTHSPSIAQDGSMSKSYNQKAANRKARQEKIENYIRQQEEGALVFNKQTVYGFRLNTDGWSLFFEQGRMKSIKVANIYTLELGEKKHPKESKVTNTFDFGNFIQSGNPYVYGKRNIFYQIKPGYGQQRMIGAKANKNGIALHCIYSGGLSIGLMRPYYVTIIDEPFPNVFVEKDIKYDPDNPTDFLTPGNIIQGTGLRNGWNELSIAPGLHAKAGLRFDYGRFNELISAIEVGANVEYYFRDIQILINNDPRKFFFTAYVAILIGKRN